MKTVVLIEKLNALFAKKRIIPEININFIVDLFFFHSKNTWWMNPSGWMWIPIITEKVVDFSNDKRITHI